MWAEFISHIDLFPAKDILQPSKNVRFTTKVGILCSLPVWGLMMYVLFQGLQGLALRTEPNTTISNVYQQDPVKMTINHTSFPFAFGLSKDIGNKTLKFEGNESTVYPNCNLTQLFQDIEIFDRNAIVENITWYCAEPNGSWTIGSHDNSSEIHIEIMSMNRCPDLSHPSSLYVYYQDIEIDPLDYESPTKKGVKVKKITANCSPEDNSYPVLQFSLQLVNISTDSNWLITTINEKDYGSSSIKVFDIESSLYTTSPTGNSMVLEIVLSSNLNVVQKYTRVYSTVPAILGDVTGILTAATFIFGWIVKEYAQVRLKNSLLKEIFNANMPHSEKKRGGLGQNDEDKQKLKSQAIASVIILKKLFVTEGTRVVGRMKGGASKNLVSGSIIYIRQTLINI